MMKKTITTLAFGLAMMSIGQAQELTQAHKDSLKTVVDRYFELNLKVYSAGSTVDDVNQLFALFTDNFEYIHPKYGGTYSRQDIYDGYVNNQANGAYNGSTFDVKRTQVIYGLNGVAVERAYLKRRKDGSVDEVDPGLTVFEFRDGKISVIKEYW